MFLLLLYACITFNQLFHQLEEDGIVTSQELKDGVTIRDLGCLLKNMAKAKGGIKVDQEDWKNALIEIERLLRKIFEDKLGPNDTVDDERNRQLESQAISLLQKMNCKPIRKQKWSDALLRHCILSEPNDDALHKVVLLLRRLGFFSPGAFGLVGLLIDPATEIEDNTIFGACFEKSGITKLPVEEASGDEEAVTPFTILSPSSVKKAANTDPSAGMPCTPAVENRVRFTTPTAQSVSGTRSVGVQHQAALAAEGIATEVSGAQAGAPPSTPVLTTVGGVPQEEVSPITLLTNNTSEVRVL